MGSELPVLNRLSTSAWTAAASSFLCLRDEQPISADPAKAIQTLTNQFVNASSVYRIEASKREVNSADALVLQIAADLYLAAAFRVALLQPGVLSQDVRDHLAQQLKRP